MSWFRRKEKPIQMMNSSAEFEEAARASVAEAHQEFAGAVAEAAAEAEAEGAAFDAEIGGEFAEEAARLCFSPLAKYDHPQWELSDEEAQKLAPRFERLFDALASRYAPAIMLRLAARHPEMFNLSVVMLLMYWKKYRRVSKAKQAEAAARPRPPVVLPKPSESVAKPAESESADAEKFDCELCGESFPSFDALAGHLPCQKKKGGNSVQ